MNTKKPDFHQNLKRRFTPLPWRGAGGEALQTLPILFLALFLCSCQNHGTRGPAPLTSATLRYLADTRSLQVDVVLPDSTLSPPTAYGSPLQPITATRYRQQRKTDFVSPIRLSVPGTAGYSDFTTDLVAPSIDSLPSVCDLSNTLTFPTASVGLEENESLLLFFEPKDRNKPHRILVTGPTATGTVTLPVSATTDIPAGEYGVYLVKQQLFRDSTENVRLSLQTEYFTPTKMVTVARGALPSPPN